MLYIRSQSAGQWKIQIAGIKPGVDEQVGKKVGSILRKIGQFQEKVEYKWDMIDILHVYFEKKLQRMYTSIYFNLNK